jgi:cyanophycinase-like exopeptidase
VRDLEEHPGHVGFGVDEATALLVDGREIEVIGDNMVTICLAAGENREALSLELKEGNIADLTALCRAARDRTGAAFPLVETHSPCVPTWFHDVLRRGGVIGGSSAGASIQGEYLARGSPLGNTYIMAEGYERSLNFLPGVAIDQHFTQRGRAPEMAKLIDRFPQLLGIGIDESTAIVIQGTSYIVVGEHSAHVFTQLAQIGERQVVRSSSPGVVYEFREMPPASQN